MANTSTDQIADRSLTADLIDLIFSKEISPEDERKTAFFVLDAIANMIGGRNSEPGKILSRWAHTAPVFPARQAFIAGALTHILEVDDLHRASVTHPGCVVVPAVLAIGANMQASAKDVLHAVLYGFEAMCRIGNSVGDAHYKIWHNTATCGPYGAATAVAWLLDLDEKQCLDALGNAGTQSSGLWQFLETGAMSKHLHAGRAAEAGLVAAELAAFGFTGPPQILEGAKGFYAAACPDADPSAVLAAPTDPWQLTATSIKPWPSCRHTHPGIDAGLELHALIKGEEILSIDAHVYQATMDVCDRPEPNSEYEAKFSIQHCIAAAINDGKVEFSSFNEASRNRLSAVRRKVNARVSEPYKSAYPSRYWGADVSVETKSGVHSVSRKACKGDPESGLSDDEFIEKAQMLMSFGGLSGEQCKNIINAVLDLPNGSAEWDWLTGAFPESIKSNRMT